MQETAGQSIAKTTPISKKDIDFVNAFVNATDETDVKIKKKHKFNAIASGGYKSQLEVRCAAAFKANGIAVDYEKFTAVLSPSFEYCHVEYVKKELKEKCKGREITLTPDFVAEDFSFCVEAKGLPTPDFQLKWKLFKIYCKEHYPNMKLFIVRNMGDLEKTIAILKANEDNHKQPPQEG